MVIVDGLSDALVDTGVPTKADAHAAKDTEKTAQPTNDTRRQRHHFSALMYLAAGDDERGICIRKSHSGKSAFPRTFMYVVPEKKAHGAEATGVMWGGALNSKNLCRRGWGEEHDEFGILNFRPFNIGHASLSFRDGRQ